MKTQILTLLFIWVGALFTPTQKYTINPQQSSLEIVGTSSIHDWEIKAKSFSGTAAISEENGLTIDQLGFDVKVAHLKSDYTAMDKNTRKALNAEKYPTIHYELLKVINSKNDGKNYTLLTKGKLTIAGKTKEVEMTVKAVKESSKAKFSGKLTFDMTDFGVDPPTAVMGTIKTGNQITIKFNVEYKI